MIFTIAAVLLLSQSSAGFVIQNEDYRRAALSTDAASPLAIPDAAPVGSSPIISSNFVGFAFEETSFPQYAGTSGNPNSLSVNLMNNIASRTDSRAYIRVGGTSLDRAVYVPTQADAVDFPPGQSGNVPANVTLGPAYFGSFSNFPNALYTLCIPLATNNLTNSLQFIKDGYPVVKNQLKYLEIGNEPQSYPGSVRLPTYTPQKYITQWLNFSDAISAAVGLTSTSAIYQAVALGSPSLYETSDRAAMPGPWYPNALFQQGFGQVASRFGSVSMHYYQTRADSSLPGATQLRQELMNHTITVTKMTFYETAISYFAQNYPTIGIALDEAASSLNGATNDYALETTFGAALWQVDWMLWCMYIGIKRIGWQQISASAFDLWQPTNYKGRSPEVLPAYYAMLFAADFIGSSGDTQVINMDLHSDVFSAYAAYASVNGQSKRLARVALVNLNYWVGPVSSGNPRPSQTFQLQFPSGVTSVIVRYLDSSAGATASTGSQITYQGYSYSTANNGQAQLVSQNSVNVKVTNGVANIVVKSSEAVMVLPQYGN